MKGGTSLITLIIVLAAQLSMANVNVCEKIFEPQPMGGEYLPFPLINDSFFDSQFSEATSFYSPEAGLSFEFSHLMGAEYLVKMTRVWDGYVGRGVLVYSGGTFAGFVQNDGSNVLLDFGAITVNGQTQYYFQLDGQCFRAELESHQLP